MEGELPKMKVDEIALTKGSYSRMSSNSDHAKKTETILYDVIFPIRMKVTISSEQAETKFSEQVEIEFYEEGNYSVNVRINQ